MVRFLLFGCIRDVWLPYETRCKTGRTSARVRATKSRRNFWQRMHPIHPHWTLNWYFGAFRTIWVHSGPFGCHTKLGVKRAELVQKFVPRSRVGICRTHPIHPITPKLMFWCVSYYLGTFETIWLPDKTRFKMRRTCAKVRATKSRRNFSQ